MILDFDNLIGIRPPFRTLVYPIPSEHGLGVHATIDLSGAMRFGPDTEWIEPKCTPSESPSDSFVKFKLPDWINKSFCESDYIVDIQRANCFYADIREYWPGLPDGSLTPDYSGIRPKIIGPDSGSGGSVVVPPQNLRDFIIEGSEVHGVEGLINMYGIESPGLTCSLSIADLVKSMLTNNSK